MDQPSSTESNAITLRIKFKSASLDEFISRYGADVSPGGIFIRTKQPVDVGTSLQFDFTLADSSALLSGLGTVAWVRESDPARANNVPGMGLRFDKLTLESQHTTR
jgi:molecular chaperone DnaK